MVIHIDPEDAARRKREAQRDKELEVLREDFLAMFRELHKDNPNQLSLADLHVFFAKKITFGEKDLESLYKIRIYETALIEFLKAGQSEKLYNVAMDLLSAEGATIMQIINGEEE